MTTNISNIESIKSLLVPEFHKELFSAALHNLSDKNNPLRFNNFAYCMREMLRNVFSYYAPDDNIIKCIWYKNETDKVNGVSRRQRIIYMVHGGLSKDFFSDGMQEDLKDKMSLTIKLIDGLSKYTHITENTFNIPDDTVDEMTTDTLNVVCGVLRLTSECRVEVREFLHKEISSQVEKVLYENVFDALDDKSTHTTIDGFDLEDFEIVDIDNAFITITGEGTINCNLQYGSGADVRNDVGLVMDESFPMKFTCKSLVSDPYDIELHPRDIIVDESGWYGEG